MLLNSKHWKVMEAKARGFFIIIYLIFGALRIVLHGFNGSQYQLASPSKALLTLESVNSLYSSFIPFATLIVADCFYDTVHLNEIKLRQHWVIMFKKYVFPLILFGGSVVISVIGLFTFTFVPTIIQK